ncbi:MAG: hypothetical protein RL333_370 [Pseudomonadota bacterium]
MRQCQPSASNNLTDIMKMLFPDCRPSQSLTYPVLLLCGLLASSNSVAETPESFIKLYGEQCKQENASFQGFDPERGRQLYSKQQASDWSCATCHTEDPKSSGEHCETHKKIQPIAPSANPDRFTDAAKVEKWFKRSCKDVLGRECSAQEKGDFLTYLASQK